MQHRKKVPFGKFYNSGKRQVVLVSVRVFGVGKKPLQIKLSRKKTLLQSVADLISPLVRGNVRPVFLTAAFLGD